MILQLLAIVKMNQFVLYDKPYQLNIVGIRSKQVNANAFDDTLHVFYKDSRKRWVHIHYPITTDPGTYWLKNPMQVDGTAILKQGQYINAYRIGLHRGQYKALVEAKPVTVIRDYNRDAYLDFFNGRETTGYYGINIHRARVKGETGYVDKWSAGCQVFQRISDFIHFMSLCEKHRSLYGNAFTYTLVDARAVNRMRRRYTIYGAGASTVLGAGLYYILKFKPWN